MSRPEAIDKEGLALVHHALGVKLALELGQPRHAADSIERTRQALDDAQQRLNRRATTDQLRAARKAEAARRRAEYLRTQPHDQVTDDPDHATEGDTTP